MQQGPLVSKKQLDKVLDYIKKGQEEGEPAWPGTAGNFCGGKGGNQLMENMLVVTGRPTVVCTVMASPVLGKRI